MSKDGGRRVLIFAVAVLAVEAAARGLGLPNDGFPLVVIGLALATLVSGEVK